MLRYISLIICLALLSSFFLSAAGGAQKVMSVQVKEGQLRASPSHFGKIVARISYGHQMTVLEETGDWKLLSAAGGDAQGWMHATALTNKRLVLRAGQGDVGTSVSQVRLRWRERGLARRLKPSTVKPIAILITVGSIAWRESRCLPNRWRILSPMPFGAPRYGRQTMKKHLWRDSRHISDRADDRMRCC